MKYSEKKFLFYKLEPETLLRNNLHSACNLSCQKRTLKISGQFFLPLKKLYLCDFPGGAVVKNLPANAGDMGSIPGLGRSHMPRSN